MKLIIGILVLVSFTSISCKEPNASKLSADEPVAKIVSYIESNCAPPKPCTLRLDQITGFEWDTLYFFEARVEDPEISKVLGATYSSDSPYYSRKWFFVKNNQILRSKIDQVEEVDKPLFPGDIDFDLDKSGQEYAVFPSGSTFSLERIRVANGESYRLKCVSCL